MAKNKKTYDGLKYLIKNNEYSGGEKTSYAMTPENILLCALKQVYDIDTSEDKLDRFMSLLLTDLSKLASSGCYTDLFGKDFNEFFGGYIGIINLCGRMKTAMDKYGITLDDELGENKEDEDDN